MSQLSESESAAIRTKVQSIFTTNKQAMTSMVAQQLGVPEIEIVRHLPDARSTQLDPARIQDLIRDFEAIGKVFVIVNNGAVVMEAHGQFGGFSLTGPFLNVQTDSLDMHISHAKLAAVFAVVKAGHMDGVETVSFQFFTKEGNAAFKTFLTFGGTAPSPERCEQFNTLRDKYALKS